MEERYRTLRTKEARHSRPDHVAGRTAVPFTEKRRNCKDGIIRCKEYESVSRPFKSETFSGQPGKNELNQRFRAKLKEKCLSL